MLIDITGNGLFADPRDVKLVADVHGQTKIRILIGDEIDSWDSPISVNEIVKRVNAGRCRIEGLPAPSSQDGRQLDI